ncbi:MAG TPA: F0F1 ATP synthase subunit beta, partial [Patescibacteria group bacterium]|nr:F0F1 ATP synthase subunit beta [Patescibacteria group bacterium]
MNKTVDKSTNEKGGIIKQVIGAVVDVHFPGAVPEMYTALRVKNGDKSSVLEVASHLGGNQVRCISMET